MGYPTISQRAKNFVRHRATAQMSSAVKIYSGVDASSSLNETTGLVTSSLGTLLYTVKARFSSVEGGGVMDIGENVIATKSTYCSIPWDSEYIPRDSIIIVKEFIDDPQNENACWRVLATDGGGLIRAVRRMQVVSFTPTPNWSW